jgi:hypothetical protein
VNGDGIPDLVFVNKYSPNVGVLLGNGNGTFQAQQTFAVGSFPKSVTVADVNGDGKPDVLVANYYAYSVSLLLGNGDGTFQAQQTFSVPDLPDYIAAADVNGDGKPDLLVSSQGSFISVFLSNGNGTFQTPQNVTVGNGNDDERVFAVADVNGDGKPDLVATDYIGQSVDVALGNGDGTFQAQHTFAVGRYPESALVADVNGDGKPDLVTTSNTDGSVSLLLGNGNGTFQAQQTFSDSYATFVRVADVNGDGRADLVLGNYSGNNVNVMLNTSNGNFTGQTYTIVPSLDTITGTTSVDQITLVQDPDAQHIDWTLNGTTVAQMAINDPAGLTINGAGSNDVITLDYTHGDPLPNKLNLNGVFTLNGLVTTGNPLANTTLDLEKSTLFINYGAPVNDPMATIRGYLKTGYNGGTWTGTSANGSIRSSAAAANVNQTTAIGYSDSADGQNVNTTPNTIELKYTLYADTHLLGTVGFADFSKLTQTFGNNTGGTWSTGDWTYDGSVNFSDFNLLTRTYGTPLGSQADVPAAAAPTPSSEAAATPSSGAAVATPTQSAALISADTSDNKKSAKATAKSKPVTTVTVKPAKAKANAKKPRH